MDPNDAERTQRYAKPRAPMTKAALDVPKIYFKDGKIDREKTLDAQPIVQPSLIVEIGRDANVEYPLRQGTNLIGRLADDLVDIDLARHEGPEQTFSSRKHAYITFENQKLYIEDCYSRNGTMLNGHPIVTGEKYQLRLGDRIQIGAVQLRVHDANS